MIVRVVLEGGVPWGFRVDTDGRRHAPRICKVRTRGKGERAGLKPDDIIMSINGRPADGMRAVDVIALIQQSHQVLCLELERSARQHPVPHVGGRETVDDTHRCSFDSRFDSLSDELLQQSEVHSAVLLPQHTASAADCDTYMTAVKAIHSDEDDVSDSAASATFNLQGLDNCIRNQPAVDFRQSNSNRTFGSRSVLRQADPDTYRVFTDDLYTRSEEQSASSLETMDWSETTASDSQKQNSVNNTDVTETRNEPLILHQINNANHDIVIDSLLSTDEETATGKHIVRFELFKGIGPTDEATGIPIASRSMVEKSYQKEWYRQMYLAIRRLTGLKCPPKFVFAGEDPDPRLAVACRLSLSSAYDESPINAALRRNLGRQMSADNISSRRQSYKRSYSSCSSSPRISPQPVFTQTRFGQTSDAMYKTPNPRTPTAVAESRISTCNHFSPPVARQVTTSASMNGQYDDPLSPHSARILNGDRAFSNGCETFSNGVDVVFVNGRTDHDANVSNKFNNASHFHGSTTNGQNDSVPRLRALFNYSPRHADELQLNKDDIIYLSAVCDDGWFLGTSERTRQFGTFPGNYVRPVN